MLLQPRKDCLVVVVTTIGRFLVELHLCAAGRGSKSFASGPWSWRRAQGFRGRVQHFELCVVLCCSVRLGNEYLTTMKRRASGRCLPAVQTIHTCLVFTCIEYSPLQKQFVKLLDRQSTVVTVFHCTRLLVGPSS